MTEEEMSQLEIVQTKEPCISCGLPFKERDKYRMRSFDLRRKGWSKFNRRLKADHTMQLIAHVNCSADKRFEHGRIW